MKDDIVYRAKKGDHEAFRELVEEYTLYCPHQVGHQFPDP